MAIAKQVAGVVSAGLLLASLGAQAQSPVPPPLSAPPPATAPAREQAQEHALKAQAYVKLNRLSEAEAEFKQAQAIDPSWHDLTYNLGVLLEAEGRTQEAVAALRAYLPFATPEEAPTLREHIAVLEIKADDERKAAAQKAAQEAAQRAEAERQAKAEQERQQQLEAAARERQRITIRAAEPGETFGDVKVRTGTGVAVCPGPVTDAQPCVLRLDPGPAKLVFNGRIEGNEVDISIPSGPSEADLKRGFNGPIWLTLTIGGMLVGSAGAPMALIGFLGNRPNMPLAITGCAMTVVGLGGGLTALLALSPQDSFTYRPTEARREPSAPPPRRFALGIAPSPHGGQVGAAVTF